MKPSPTFFAWAILALPLALSAQTPPSSVLGQSITVTEAAGGGNLEDRLIFTSATQGQEVDPIDNDIDGFTYVLTPTGASTATLVLTFKPDKWDEYTLNFAPSGGGTFTLREFDDNALKDTDSGNFTDNRGVGGLPSGLNGVTIETFEAAEIDTPERLDFLTATRGREVEPGDVDPFSYTYQVTGATTASAVLVFRTNFKWDEFDFTFTSNTAGTFVQRRYDKGAFKDTKNGTFVMAANDAILDPIASGWYDGVLEVEDLSGPDDDDFDGHVRILLAGRGGFTAKLHLPNREVTFRGAFDQTGKYVNTITLRDSSTVAADFVLEAIASGYKVTGSVTYLGVKYLVDGDQRNFNARRNACPTRGAYTMILTGDGSPAQTLAIGDGFASVRVNSNGQASLRGRLADGFPWQASVMVRQDGDLTFLTSLYRGKGSIGGRLVFNTVAGVSDFAGTLHWKRESGVVYPAHGPLYGAGFDVDRTAVGSKYAAPRRGQLVLPYAAAPSNLKVAFSGAEITPEQTATGSLSARHVATFDAASGVSLRFSPSDGLFAGSFTDNSGGSPVVRRYYGAAFQIQAKGFGHFLGATEGGSVDVLAP